MNNDQRILEIDDIERALLGEDPTLPKRMRALERADTLNVFVVFSLLATGAVLLAVGLATLSFGVWTAGVAALIMSALVDQGHKRTLLRAPATYEGLTSVQSARSTHWNS